MRNWLDYVQPVNEEDAQFVKHEEDLVTLRPGREHAWLDSSVEKMLQWCNCAPVEVSNSTYLYYGHLLISAVSVPFKG